MTKLTKAIRHWIGRPCLLGIKVGCLLVLTFASSESSHGQVVRAAGEKPDAPQRKALLPTSGLLIGNDSTRLSSRRLLVTLPQDNKSDSSPSDVKKDDAAAKDEADKDKVDQTDEASKEDTEKDAENDNKVDPIKPATPAQSAALRLGVDPVNIATDSIGRGDWAGVLPENTAANRAPASMGLPNGQTRGIPVTQVNWKPANICHLPLYFEDAMLERHGHVRWGHAQPVVSGVKFFTTMPLLPYLKTLHPPCEYRYQLGHFRPGSCAPALKDHLPWDRRAAVVETVSLGAFFWAAPL